MSAYKSCNSKEAVTYAEAELPDLVFMDLDLPDLDGVKTTAILKQNPKTSQIPVVAVTVMDVRTIIRGKSFESGYCNLLDKTGLASNAKATFVSILSSNRKSNLVKRTTGFR
jgi:CheY-like chemotaxis protein